MVTVKDMHIINPEIPDRSYVPDFSGTCLVDEFFKLIREKIEEHGDTDFLANADLGIQSKEWDSIGPWKTKLSELVEKSKSLSQSLFSLGLQKGDYVHLLLPSNASFYFPVFATWLCQGIVSPADPTLSKQVLQLQIGELRSKLVICTEDTLSKVVSIIKDLGHSDCKIIILGKGEEDRSNNIYNMEHLIQEGNYMKTDLDPVAGFQRSDVGLLVWSSGTTGKPKGIQISFHEIAALILKKEEVYFKHVLQTTCFFHAGGFFTPFYSMKSGCTNYFFEAQSLEGQTKKIFTAVNKFRPAMMIIGSHHAVQISNFMKEDLGSLDLSSVKMIMPLGSSVPSSIQNNIQASFEALSTLLTIYGMSEVGQAVTISITLDSLGYPAPGTTVKITNPDTGEVLGPNKVGEIRARFEHPFMMMVGYLNRPEESRAFFGENGFIHTGDLGHYDEKGMLYFDGRLKELIKVNNCHLYPIELDEIIQKHPDVLDVGVFGKPDHTVQELVTAAVVKRSGSSLSEEDIVELVASQVDDFKRLRGGVVFVDSLPRNPQGKILRRKLREIYGQ